MSTINHTPSNANANVDPNANVEATSNYDIDLTTTSDLRSSSNIRHPRQRVLLTETQVEAFLDAAKSTNDDFIYDCISEGLSRCCAIVKSPKPIIIEAPPNEQLKQRVDTLQHHANELAKKVIELRKSARKQIELNLLQSHRYQHINNLLSQQQQQQQQQEESIVVKNIIPSSVIKSSLQKLSTISKVIKKTYQHATETERRTKNTRHVLQRLKEDKLNTQNADESQTIQADWTVNLNVNPKRITPSLSSNMTSPPTPNTFKLQQQQRQTSSNNENNADDSYGSPIPNQPPRLEDDFEESTLSPFITPRSKIRRRTARQLRNIQPLRLDMPR